MSRSTHVQTNFTAGEFSPRLFGRTDIAKIRNAAATVENVICQKHGGASRRPGTKYVNAVRDSADATRLIGFEYSVDQTYMLEFGDQYIRFYRDSGQLTKTHTVSTASWAGGTATVTLSAAHTILVGTTVTVSGISPSGYNGTYVVTGVASTTIDYAVVSDPGAYSSGGSVVAPYEISSPWASSELSEIKYTQSADILYLCHPDYAPRELRRNADTDWELASFDYTDGPYLDINTTAVTLTPAATSGTGVNVTASAITAINDGAGFQTTDVGRWIRIKHSSTWGAAQITSRTSTTVVVVDIAENFGAATASANWRLGSWSDTDGWPWVPSFHQERLYFGGSDAHPQTLWGSVVGDFTNFQPSQTDGTVADDDGVTYTISANQVNAIRTLNSNARGIMIGTQGGPWVGKSTAAFDPISPTNFAVFKQSSYGVSDTVRAHEVGPAILMVQRGDLILRELAFSFEADQFVAPDLTILSEHVTLGGVVDSAYQDEPDSVLWLARADGQLLGMTYEREQEVVAWHRHVLGGSLTGSNQPIVESIATIREGNEDQLWMIVKRTIDSATVRYIEYLTSPFDASASDAEDAIFVDSSLTYDGAATDTITGLDHLEGETVSILADGAVHPDRTVSSGSITLKDDYSVVQVGLSYTSTLKSMPIHPETTVMDSRGKIGRVYKATIRFLETLGAKIGDASDNLDTIPFREAGDPMDAPPPLFTGYKTVAPNSSYEKGVQLILTQEQPLPMTILAIIWEFDLGGI